jgi:uncharacterized RDD family membrane protein YckC
MQYVKTSGSHVLRRFVLIFFIFPGNPDTGRFTNSEAIKDNNLIYNLFLFFIAYFYFVWHWVNGGRTLGMRAWHIKLINREMDQMCWRNATARFCLSLFSLVCFGLGFVWAFCDKEKLTFHDRYSNSRLINDKN